MGGFPKQFPSAKPAAELNNEELRNYHRAQNIAQDKHTVYENGLSWVLRTTTKQSPPPDTSRRASFLAAGESGLYALALFCHKLQRQR